MPFVAHVEGHFGISLRLLVWSSAARLQMPSANSIGKSQALSTTRIRVERQPSPVHSVDGSARSQKKRCWDISQQRSSL